MSYVFNDPDGKQGIVQQYERECGFEYGDVSGSANLLAALLADERTAVDEFTRLAITADGNWQYDDSNHTKLPIITTDLKAGRRFYPLIKDEQGNFILEIYRVFAKDSSGAYQELAPVDVSNRSRERGGVPGSGRLYSGGLSGYTDGRDVQGVPQTFDAFSNGFTIDPISPSDVTAGLKVYINREGLYPSATDTTLNIGVPGIFQRYFVVKPAFEYARINNRANYDKLAKEVLNYEGDEKIGLVGSIQSFFGRRSRSMPTRMRAAYQNNH